ncbi:MAG TPA: prolyl oligopeptidase family serine peptidase, partial [Sphingobacterium sp.]|nr:prolyl oligopeptidase family serine peptidase [Sphingobacterium sp.]
PIAYVDNWKSPVLLIHADDDRNVGFTHSVDLYQRLKKRNVEVETLIIPDDTHHWMLHKNLQRISTATVKFLYSKLTENSD